MLGQKLSRYRIVEKIGEGGMGVIYRGFDERLGRDVALKVLSPALVSDVRARLRLQHEASLLSKLNHPNITTIHDFEIVNDIAFLVMELVPGQNLLEVLAAGPVDERQILEWARQLCGGLAAAHAVGIIHRDLKPANVRITPAGRLKILDFGLAKLLQFGVDDATSIQSAAGALSGTLPYMAPEQLNGGAIDARTDIHAVGALLYELSTGRRPFTGRTAGEVLRAIALDPPPSPASLGAAISAPMERAILRCLEKEPDRRYQSAGDLLAELNGPGQNEPASVSASQRAATPGVSEARTSIALMPFEDATDTTEYAYLSFALADAVAVLLSRIPALNVRPLSGTRRYKSGQTEPRTAGLELGVQVVFAGRFVVDPVNVRVTLEAIDVEHDHLLWATSLRVNLDSLEQIETDVAAKIEQELLPALGVKPPKQSESTPPADPRAYELYLRAIALGDDAIPNSTAVDMLRKAIDIDPVYAPAWSNLGRRLYVDASYGEGTRKAYEESEKAYQRALVLDPELVAAASGLISHWTEKGDLEGAFDVVSEMLTRLPLSVPLRSAAAYVLRFAGLHHDSATHAETALQIDRDPRLGHAALTYLALLEYERSLDFLALREGTAWAENVRMFIFLHRGSASDALSTARRIASDPVWPARFVLAFLEGQPAGEVHRLATEFISQNVRVLRDPESSFLDGTLMSFCGQPELALTLIGNAIRGGYLAYPDLQTNPLIKAIRDTNEFAELVADARTRQGEFLSHRLRSSARSGRSSDNRTSRPSP